MNKTIPMIVLGGFLGAGKTTLLNHLLANNDGMRLAVLVNDFGTLAIDSFLVARHDGDTITFANGCVCCSLGDSLMLTLDTLLDRQPPPDAIVVEASGVADPAAISAVAALEPRLRRDLVVVVADAQTLPRRVRDERLADTVARQLRVADMVILNKRDLVDAGGLARARECVDALTSAVVIEASHASLPARLVLRGELAPRVHSAAGAPLEHPFVTATVHCQGELREADLRAWLKALPACVLRAKGRLRTERGERLVQRVGQRATLTAWTDAHGADAPHALVLIGTAELGEMRLELL